MGIVHARTIVELLYAASPGSIKHLLGLVYFYEFSVDGCRLLRRQLVVGWWALDARRAVLACWDGLRSSIHLLDVGVGTSGLQ